MKKIIVPVDFSDHSKYALDVAAQLARKHDTSLLVVHMMGLNPSIITKDESQEVFEAMYFLKLAEKRFAELLERESLKDVSVETMVQNYKEFHELDRIAQEQDGDLIVMGSHGSSGMKEIFVGSNTEKVVRNASVPVLVIKNPMLNFKVEKMAFVCDFSYDFVEAYHKARNFAEMLGAEFELLYINTPESFKRTSEMENLASEFLIAANATKKEDINFYCDTTIESGIFTFSNANNIDLIAIPTHGRKGLMHFFVGSKGEEIVNHSDIPVVTFKI